MASLMGNNAKPWLYRLCSFTLMLTLLLADVFVFLEQGFIRADQALAAAGDFSVFAETTGTEVIAGAGNNVTWDNQVSASGNIALQGNTSDIDLADGGKYLVLYNTWTEQGSTGGNNRRSVASYLTLNGSSLEYGWGGGYIRDTDNDFSTYNSGAAIIDAAAGDDLAVVLDRDDSNPGAGTAIKPGTNGVSILKLDEGLDYLRIHSSAGQGDISGNTAFTSVLWDTADEVDTGSFGFSAPDTGVTVSGNSDQKFLVTTNVKLQNTVGGGRRQNYELRLTLDGVEVPGTRSTAYMRFDNGDINSTIQYTGVIQKTSGSDQTLQVEVRSEGLVSDTTAIIGDETALAMVALPPAAEVLSLTTNADQVLASTPTVFTFGTQISTAPSFLSHSVVSATDDITIDTDGDYVVFSTTYTSRISGVDRDVPRVEWRLDGLTQSYGGHGHYNRGDEGNEDTFTSGGSSGAIFPNLTSGQVLELIQQDETNSGANADFLSGRVAVQVLELSELIADASTDISIIGSQAATLAPSTANVELGEQIVIIENNAARNVTNIKISEDGTANANTDLSNVRLYYDFDTSLPYDCVSESYTGDEAQYGSTSTFSGADGSITFADSETISPTQAMCAYVVFDTTASASDGDTVNVFIESPSLDIIVTGGGELSPLSGIGLSFSTFVSAEITQANYHWRNDDGSETGATSVTGGIENEPALAFAAETIQRLRLGINAEGSGSQTTAFKLEYGEKVTTCGDVSSWVDVDEAGGAWDMADSVNIFEGDNTTNIPILDGGVSDGAGTFVTPNGGVRDASSQTGTITIPGGDFVEVEYSVQATLAAAEGVAYCFRVVNAANAAPFLSGYDSRVPFTVPASGIDATLTDFPVYVDLSTLGADFWAGVANDGEDIRVTTGDALTELPIEVVTIDTGAETGELHFRASSLSDSSDNQFFIYFGNGSATAYAAADPLGRNAVWSNGFEAVYHLAEDPSGSGPQMIDSTGNGRDLTSEGAMTTGDLVSGQVGNAIDFDGVGDALRNAAWSWGGDQVTVSYWNNVATAEVKQNFTFGFDASGNERLSGHSPWIDNTLYWDYGTCCSGGRLNTSYAGSLDQWTHIALVSSGSSNSFMGIYLDSSLAISKTSSEQPTATVSNFDLANGEFDGRLDEFRVSDVIRSEDWIAAEYTNQDTPTSFYTVGPLETPASVLGTVGYAVYPEATLSADITVSSIGSQIATVTNDSTDVLIGGAFVITSNSGAQTVTSITVTETGSIDAGQFLSNPRIAVDFDTSAPYNCASESYGGGEPTLTGGAFTDPNGTTTITGSATVSPTQAICAYVLVDVDSDAIDGDTIDFEISLPNIDVVAGVATVGPGTAIELSGSTLVQAGALTQAGYHWRNDDGDVAGATSASNESENTPISSVFQGTQKRLRLAVSNDGNASAVTTGVRLEYGSKVTSCENVGSWQRVDTGVAFDMATTSQLVQGDDTADIAISAGGVSDPNTSLLTPNSAQLETVDQLAAATLTTSQYVKVEYALELTTESGFGTTYCFRLTDAGTPFTNYTNYPELTVQERQDFIVQRGTHEVTGTSLTLTAGADYDAPSSDSAAFVRITDTSMTGAGSLTAGAPASPVDVFAYIEDGDSLTSSFSIVRPPGATDGTRVQWEIVEYIGVAGADNEFILRDAGEVTYGASNLFATGTAVAGIVNDEDVVVFITGQLNPDADRGNYNTGLSISSWDASGDRPVLERGDADGVAASVSYAVVEFTGASWQIQRAEHTYAAAGVTETEAISAVNNPLQVFLHTQKLAGNDLFNLDEVAHEVWLSSMGAVSFRLENNSSNPSQQRSVAWVIENTQTGDGAMRVYRSSGEIVPTTGQPNTYVYPIGATVEPSNASIWANTRSSGGGDFHPRAQLGARVLNETQFELWKSDEGQNQNFRVEVVDWPVAETSIRQTYYRFYVDNDALTPTDPWPAGASDLGENTSMTDVDEPLGEGERTRIRMGLFVNNASLVTESVNFKLQYARRVTSCSAISSWNDVGDSGSGEIWRAFDASPVGGTQLLGGGALLLSVSDVAGTYEENSPYAFNPNSVEIGDYIEYDWHVENNAAIQKSSYCFRMVEGDGSVLDGYDVYPTVRTSGYTPIINNWQWFTDEENLTPSTAAAGENVAPSAVSNNEELKLRVSTTEIEGAPGNSIKFNLQYSQYPDFRDAVTLTSTSSCEENSLWCYADGAGEDNDILQSTVLSGVDSCVAGVGAGCGTANEAEGLSGVYDQPAFSTSEHEFTVRQAGARVDGVYYFRLFDATNGVPLVANGSFPSVTTEGAVLTFAVSGLDAATVIEGVTTAATTTATTVDFGSLPMGTDVDAAQRLTVFTNGTEGYRVYMNIDQPLTDSYGNTLDGMTGTNAAPATWASQCTVADTGCFGYHVGDDSLTTGSLRFALDDTFAGVESGPVEVMASNVPVTFDVSEIVYRTRVGFLQPAGDYTATVQYIVVPIF